ncbi:MAG: alpha/beta fold hydrolase [Polyangiaceae bacterium]|nr:alpha/beta fold hydrolase [Polyangiaceae bacterium]
MPPLPASREATAELERRIERSLSRGLAARWPFPEDEGRRLHLSAGDHLSWVIESRGGRVVWRARRPRSADAQVHTDLHTLAELLEGQRSGVELWLKGYLRVRGSIALALKLEALIQAPRPAHFSRPRRVRAGGIDTFILEAGEQRGSEPPVILLHGLGATLASMLPTLAALSETRRVIAADLPGFGDSDKPLVAYDARFFARWAVDLLDALGIERASFVGNSMGGRISIEVGLRYPERVAKLALYCPAVAFRRLRQLVPLVRLARPELGVVPLAVPRRVMLAVMQQIFSKPDRVPAPWFDAAADEFSRVFATRRGRIALFSAARQIYLDSPFGDRGFWEQLRGLTPPALFVWGDRDVLIPSGFARHVEEALPSAVSRVLEDCGHVPQFELPHVLHPLVLSFLDG